MRKFETFWLPVLVYILALLPLALIVWDFTQRQLTANPIQEIQLRTGRYTLTLLLLSLACTPVSILFGFKPALRLRRPLGIAAFVYAGLHLLNFIGLDYGFDFSLLQEGVLEKRFVLAGFAAFLCLLPSAMTSTRGWRQRLGRNWHRLHQLVYLSGLFAVLHFIWQTKIDYRRPVLYGVILLFLLAVRIPAIRRAFDRLYGAQEKENPKS